MRTPLLCLLLALAVPASAQIYSYTDANGNKVFTNEPPAGSGAKTVQLQPLNTMDKPPAAQVPAAAETTVETPLPYSRIELTGLPGAEALRANNGTFTVGVALEPPLQPGHSLQLLLDGQPYGTPGNVPLLQLTNVDRGEHSLAVQVLSGSTVLQQSAPVNFTVQRTHINN